MKWFDRWFANKCLRVLRGTNNEDAMREDSIGWAKNYSRRKISLSGGSAIQPEGSSLNSRPMRFNIHSASGGWVLEYNYYDDSKDENINSLHVINNDDDLGQAISQIITFEILRK